MAFQSQARFGALVNALELNSQGASPGALSEVIAGVYNLADHLYLPRRERFSLGPVAAGTAAGDWAFATGGTVPSNETWLLLQYSIIATIPIGTTVEFSPAVQMPLTGGGGNSAYQIGPAQGNTLSALASAIRAYMDRPYFLMPPGSILAGVTHQLSAATAFNAFGNCEFVRFRI